MRRAESAQCRHITVRILSEWIGLKDAATTRFQKIGPKIDDRKIQGVHGMLIASAENGMCFRLSQRVQVNVFGAFSDFLNRGFLR